MKEVWKDIEGYVGYYQISNKGRVKSLARYKKNHSKLQSVPEIIVKVSKNSAGYFYVNLWKIGNYKRYLVHRLIALSFIINKDNKPQINHINGVRDDNKIENLEWSTQSENVQHAYDIGLHKHNGKAIYQMDIQNNTIREFESALQAERELKLSRGGISKCLNGKQKIAYGYKWKFKEVIWE